MLTYSSVEKYSIGELVVIPFGKQTKNGVVIRETKKPTFALKPIERAIGSTVPETLLELSRWMSQYYATRLAIVLQTVLPSGLEKSRRIKKTIDEQTVKRDATIHPLNDEQIAALNVIQKSPGITKLLYGVTGSGKTRVYQELIKEQLLLSRSVIVLVPEIALTPQLWAEFQSLHKNVLVLHSKLTQSQRHTFWNQINESDEPWIIVGPRSALFSPLKQVGLMIIDESHEPSYQQDSQPKYSALRVARKLAELHDNATLVLGSATPSIVDYYYAKKTNTPIVELKKPTKKRNTTIEIIDQTDKGIFGSHPIFSKRLLELMNNSIVQEQQILLFHNRRGTARMTLCADCGWSAECSHCHLPMRLHHDTHRLLCHVCGIVTTPPKSCPECKSVRINFQGFGSKRIETEVRKLFPSAVIARFDSDTKPEEQLHTKYQQLYDGSIQIIVGTQGIAKGLDLPRLSTVGIVQADSELFIPDFSSSERSFQLTTQVIGRAGRAGIKSHVVIQTLNTEHAAIVHAAEQSFDSFYAHEIIEREAEHMPPFTHLLLAKVGYTKKQSAKNEATKLASSIKKSHPGVHVRGPSPSFHEHKGNKFYQQLVITSSRRGQLVDIASSLPARWQYTLDPPNLL